MDRVVYGAGSATRLIARKLRYSARIHSPQAALMFAILMQGVADSFGSDYGRYEREGKRFIGSDEFRTICNRIELNPDYVVRVITAVRDRGLR